MRVDEFDFALPEELIALRPVEPRSASRLLVSGHGGIADSAAARLAEHLRPGDILVFNDTSVIPARLSGARVRASRDGSGRAAVEATLIRRLGADLWEVLARPGRKLAVGDRIEFAAGLAAILEKKGEGGAAHLRFDRAGPDLDAAIGEAGMMPLPPYIAGRRAPDARDEVDYQSIFAERPGAVAAPTASLHFDAGLLAALEARGVLSARLTLHVGAGTFLPVKSETLDGHRMHSEWGRIDAGTAAAINAARAAGGRAIPVGTTALRLMESAAREEGGLAPFEGETDIFIHPGHRFRAVDGLMTNFHLPRSTLLMLVAALIGVERTRDVYAHAIAERYRFYSYGDASLLFP